MMKMDDNKLFIDTNVLIYANANNYVWQTEAQHKLSYYFSEDYEIWISRQVIREYLSNISKLMISQSTYQSDILLQDVNNFQEEFMIADENSAITFELMRLIKKYNVGGKQVHDCNIVATMLHYGIANILTHNVKDFIRYEQEGINIIPLIPTN